MLHVYTFEYLHTLPQSACVQEERARGERRMTKTKRNHQVRRGQLFRRVARLVELMGLVRRRERRVQKGVGG